MDLVSPGKEDLTRKHLEKMNKYDQLAIDLRKDRQHTNSAASLSTVMKPGLGDKLLLMNISQSCG